MTNTVLSIAQTWECGAPRSQGNAFDWRSNYKLNPTKFSADVHHRTPLYAKWCQTGMSVPWDKYRATREVEAKKERRVHALPAKVSSISIEPRNVSRISDIPKSQRSRK